MKLGPGPSRSQFVQGFQSDSDLSKGSSCFLNIAENWERLCPRMKNNPKSDYIIWETVLILKCCWIPFSQFTFLWRKLFLKNVKYIINSCSAFYKVNLYWSLIFGVITLPLKSTIDNRLHGFPSSTFRTINYESWPDCFKAFVRTTRWKTADTSQEYIPSAICLVIGSDGMLITIRPNKARRFRFGPFWWKVSYFLSSCSPNVIFFLLSLRRSSSCSCPHHLLVVLEFPSGYQVFL